jgi:hypothetical protein
MMFMYIKKTMYVAIICLIRQISNVFLRLRTLTLQELKEN